MTDELNQQGESSDDKPRHGPGRRWVKGQSGNPAGRRPGQRHRSTVLLEKLLTEDAAEVAQAVVELAKTGNIAAAKLVLDRACPVPRDRPVAIELPNIVDAAGCADAAAAVLAAVARGELTPSEGAAITGLIEARRRSIELVELEARIAALEGTRR